MKVVNHPLISGSTLSCSESGLYRLSIHGNIEKIRSDDDICSALYQANSFSLDTVTGDLVYAHADRPVLLRLNTTQGGPRVIKDGCIASNSSPSWSPSGRRIAFSGGCGPIEGGSVHLISSDGRSLRSLRRHSAGIAEDYPSWSPDGTALVFHLVVDDESSQIVVTDTVAGAVARTVGAGYAPAWGPGNLIAFKQRTSSFSRASSIAIVSAEGRPVKRIDLSNPTLQGWLLGRVVWAPNGREIAFALESRVYRMSLTDSVPILWYAWP